MCIVYYAYKLQPPCMYIHFSLVCVAGPTEETVVKFWQMVWEYQLTTIVMLTRCVEDNKVQLDTAYSITVLL